MLLLMSKEALIGLCCTIDKKLRDDRPVLLPLIRMEVLIGLL